MLLSIFLMILTSTSPAAHALLCENIFSKTSEASPSIMNEVIESKNDFVMSDFRYDPTYSSTGCGAACAINVLQAVRLSLGKPPKDSQDLFRDLRVYADRYFRTTTFGAHGSGDIKGLNVGSMARVIGESLQASHPESRFKIEAFQKSPHESALRDEPNIQFVPNMAEMNPFSVSATKSKVLLIEISESRGDFKRFVSTHFYTVVAYREGVVTLHDPMIKGSRIEFEVHPYFADGYPTLQFIPISNYVVRADFPTNLHFMINGFVSVEVN